MNSRFTGSAQELIQRHRQARRVDKSTLDYLAAALSPVLIMFLVGSLVFFLIQVFYHGEMKGGIQWVMFWFVLAIVLVARIGIEQSSGHASIYGALLAAATGLFLIKTHPSFLIGFLLLGVVWWSAHRLVTDCTLIDDEMDASDRGLLETPPETVPAKNTAENKKPISPSKQETPLHAPGKSLLYYSLAAIPLFGLGQAAIRGGDAGVRGQIAPLLTTYLLAAAALLLTTSFLGLRRYLRQRSLAMPRTMATRWLVSGGKIAIIVFLLSAFLPRPGVTDAWSGLATRVDYWVDSANRFAASGNPPGEGESQATSNRGQDNGKEGEARAQGASPQDESSSPRSGENQSSGRGEKSPSAAASQTTSSLLKSIVYLLIAVGIIALIIRYRAAILLFFSTIWATIRELLANLRAPTDTPQPRNPRKIPRNARIHRPFSQFQNPFHHGDPAGWTHEELVRHTYDAMQAWADQMEIPKNPHLTPLEHADSLGTRHPSLADSAQEVATAYSQLAYAARRPLPDHTTACRQLWTQMTLNLGRSQ
jgi:hypothetical protein